MASNSKARATNNLIGANEDMFLQAFDSTPKIQLANQKKLEIELQRVISVISNQNADWDNRVQAIKHFRSLVISGASETDDFSSYLKALEIPFQNNICDLRSQVVRETCITIAFLSCHLQHKFSRMAEMLLPSLIKLIPNSAKIMSTSALVALRFIIQSIQNSRLIPIIKYQLSNSKSKDVHRALCEIAERIVTIWPPQIIERHLADFMEVLRLGICNSDDGARQFSRRAFNVFAEHFREPADKLFNSLDQQRQRMLNNLNHGGGSTLSINNGPGGSSGGAANSNIISRLKTTITTNSPTSSASRIKAPTPRSTSAIDVAAQRRARARAVYLGSMHTQARPQPTNHLHHPQIPIQMNYHASPQHHHTIQRQLPQPQQSQQHQLQMQMQLQLQQQQLQKQIQDQQHQVQLQMQQHHLQQLQHEQQRHQLDNRPQLEQQDPANNQHQPASGHGDARDGEALSRAAAYLSSVINNQPINESQIVTTIKYFNSLIDRHPPEIVKQYLPEVMPPLVDGVGNGALNVRKASVFAMVSVHAKVGADPMESYLTNLTVSQRKLLEVYINKFIQQTN